jgi:hypothetical protein
MLNLEHRTLNFQPPTLNAEEWQAAEQGRKAKPQCMDCASLVRESKRRRLFGIQTSLCGNTSLVFIRVDSRLKYLAHDRRGFAMVILRFARCIAPWEMGEGGDE